MSELWQRLRQRKLVQWAVAYVAAAFALLQGIDIVAQRFAWPEQTMRFVIIALSVGFFVTLVLAWYHGERGAQRVTGTELLILALLLAIGGGLLWQFAGTSQERVVKEAATPATPDESPSAVNRKSIAVLPFENLSEDRGNAYFADGMQDMILTKLAGIGDLKVISRTSTDKYQSRPDNLRAVAAELGVATILEGSVQKAGDQVLINVQLIDAASDSHLWADAYSRTLDNIFGVEGEVAQKVADLKVISRTSTQQFQSSPENLPEIAKQLGVAHILEGSVQKVNDQVRVNVQLINAATDDHLWADTYDRRLNDIFEVESEIAKTIVDTLQVKLTGSEIIQLAKTPTTNQEAYALYLKGRFFSNKRTAADLRKSIDYFNQAIAKDPDFASAYAMLAQAWTLMPAYAGASPKDCGPPAEAAIQKALMLDETSSEAYAALGSLRATCQFNLSAARAAYERALQLNPNDATAHHWFALDVLLPFGESARGVAEMRRAVELDPLSLIINQTLGEALMRAGRLDEAIVQLHKTIEMDSAFLNAHHTLGRVFELKGQIPEAMAEYQKATVLGEDPLGLGLLGHLYGTIGRKDEATEILDQLQAIRERRYFDPYDLAIVYLGLGDREQALTALEQAYDDRNGSALEDIRVDPILDPLRGDPRFEALAEKIVPASEFSKAPAAAD